MYYYSANQYFQDKFGKKVYKLSLNAGMTCPNRDGKVGVGGCIFCSGGGSGDFAPDSDLSISKQIELAKSKVAGKIKTDEPPQYIAYFQAFTNTYSSVSHLKKIYTEALDHKDIAALSIATRPDCLSADIIELLSEINKIKPVMVELGLQTIHENTAEYINRGYNLNCFDNAVTALHEINVDVIVHLIFGLPGETPDMMMESVNYVGNLVNEGKVSGVKLQLLHILKGTKLADDYMSGALNQIGFHVLDMEEYIDLICRALNILPAKTVIHRLTGDGPKSLLMAPLWSADKKKVLNALNSRLNSTDKLLPESDCRLPG